jgi:hypothetical protein
MKESRTPKHSTLCSVFVQKDPRQGDRGDRNEGVEQDGVGCRCVLQANVSQRVVAADTEQTEHDDWPSSRAQQRPLRAQVWQGQRQHQRQRDRPAPEGERERRHLVANGAPDDHVAGPEQGGQDEQQIGVLQADRHRRQTGDKGALCMNVRT